MAKKKKSSNVFKDFIDVYLEDDITPVEEPPSLWRQLLKGALIGSAAAAISLAVGSYLI